LFGQFLRSTGPGKQNWSGQVRLSLKWFAFFFFANQRLKEKETKKGKEEEEEKKVNDQRKVRILSRWTV
jgi:hypothetical protein